MKALFGRLKKIFLAGQGRPVAAGILVWMLYASVISEADLLVWWSGATPGQAMKIAAYPFKAGRQFMFDGYQRTFPCQPEAQPVNFVAIDEQSLKQLGQWPWPRNRLADLIDAIGKHRPAAVGLDMPMPEPDQTSPDRVAANLPAKQALLTVSRYDGVVRRVPLILAVNEQLVPRLAMEMLRVASGSSAIEIEVGRNVGRNVGKYGIAAVQVAELRVPTQNDGEVWLYFAPVRAGAARTLSAADVLAGKVDPERLAGKMVLIGLTGAGLSDMRMTPLGDLLPGVEIQAQLIESLFDGRFILRPWWMKWLETSAMALIGLIMIVFIPRTGGQVAQVLEKSARAPT